MMCSLCLWCLTSGYIGWYESILCHLCLFGSLLFLCCYPGLYCSVLCYLNLRSYNVIYCVLWVILFNTVLSMRTLFYTMLSVCILLQNILLVKWDRISKEKPFFCQCVLRTTLIIVKMTDIRDVVCWLFRNFHHSHLDRSVCCHGDISAISALLPCLPWEKTANSTTFQKVVPSETSEFPRRVITMIPTCWKGENLIHSNLN